METICYNLQGYQDINKRKFNLRFLENEIKSIDHSGLGSI